MNKQIYELLTEMNTLLPTDLPTILLGKIDYICFSAILILFLCLLIRFVVDCLNEGYSFNIFKKYILQMIILGLILSPVAYKVLAGVYVNLFNVMMEVIGNKELDAVREAMADFFEKFFMDGEAGTKKLFGIFELNTTPMNLVLPMFIYLLFIISMYEILIMPILFVSLTIVITPLLLALSPFLTDMKEKVATMLFGFAIVFPVILFCIGTFMPPAISLVAELLVKESMILLTIVSLTYAFVIAYSLPVIGFISGLSFISDLRVIFPITWFEYVITKPIAFLMRTSKGKK